MTQRATSCRRGGDSSGGGEPALLSRRVALKWTVRAVLGIGVGGCAAMIEEDRRRFGWEAAAAIPPGTYRTQVWQPPGQHTAPIFVVFLVKPSVPPVRILEPYTVEDRGEVQPATIIAEFSARYPGLLRDDVEVEPLVAGGEAIGHVIRTRNIGVYAYLDRSLGQYSVRLSGVGKVPPWRRKKGQSGGSW